MQVDDQCTSAIRMVRRVFLEWQDEAEEAWLSEMSQQGWHLRAVGAGILHCRYYFERGVPTNYQYRLDYPGGTPDREEYLGVFQDAGWVHVDRLINGWEYFRTMEEVPPGETREIYTDTRSRVQKYWRILSWTAILTLLLLAFILNTPRVLPRMHDLLLTIRVVVAVITMPLAVLSGYASLQVLRKIHNTRDPL